MVKSTVKAFFTLQDPFSYVSCIFVHTALHALA